ncbi:MAG: rod shape-determining protein RodA [Flammeovirgaceae bacterium]
MPSSYERRSFDERSLNISQSIDWFTVILYAVMVTFGWLNIYAAVYDYETQKSIFDLSLNSGKQLLWIITSFVLIFIIIMIEYRFFDAFAYVLYGLMILILISVIFLGREVQGSRSWFDFGFFRVQPAEFAKFVTALAIAKFLDEPTRRADNFKTYAILFAIILLPAIIIILQNETGSAIVFAAFILVLHREGLPSFFVILGLSLGVLFVITLFLRETYFWWLVGGLVTLGASSLLIIKRNIRNITIVSLLTSAAIFFVMSVEVIITKVLKPHQQKRIEVLIDPDKDPMGGGWQITQSKIAIGSGGLWGKGFLQGTQTKFDFVPDQSTDFIFCTVGEEHGWIGSLIVIGLFVTLIYRIIYVAERQKSKFARVYGYSVASVFFFHFAVNIGMTIGLFPIIGIPLPFFSYGGSSLWSFTILLFILIKLDAHRGQFMARI